MHSVQVFGKPTAIYRFVIQTNSQCSNRYVYSNVTIMALILTRVFMFAELRWDNNIYIILQVDRRNVKWNNIATARAITAFSRPMEIHIRVACSIQEHKTGPLNKTVKFVPHRCDYGPSALVYNYNENYCVAWNKVHLLIQILKRIIK